VVVQAPPGPVVADGGLGVGVAEGRLHHPEAGAVVEGEGGRGVPQRMRADPLEDAGAAGQAGDDPGGLLAGEAAAVVGQQERPGGPPCQVFSEGVGGPGGQGDEAAAAAFGGDGEDLMAAVDAELVDVGGQGLGDPQPGQQQQAGEGVIAGAGGLGGVQEPDRLSPVEAKGGRGVVGRRPPDVGERVDRQDAFGDRVPVEAGQDGEMPPDGGVGAARLFEGAGVGVDVDAAGLEEVEVVVGAPGSPVGEVAPVGVAGVALPVGQ
jgi:hypothetical protein